MGHRNMFNTPQIFETESHQGRNHTEQPYMLMGRVSASESSSLVHPGENININGGPFPSPWTPAPMSRINSSSIPNADLSGFQQQAPGPSREPFLNHPAGGNFHTVQNSYSHPPSSSRLDGQTALGAHGSFVNQTSMGRGRGPHKRKSPSTPHVYDRDSTSRYYDAGSSSNLFLPADPWQEKPNTESHHMPWEYCPGYRVNNLSSSGECTQRNVRSRTVVDQDPYLARSHIPINSLHHSFSHRPSDRANLVDYSGQTSNASTRDWNRCLMSPAGNGGTRGADSGSFSHGPITLNALNSYANNSAESGGYINNASISQNNYGYLHQSRREVQSGFDQRPSPALRASSSSFYPGQVAASGEGPVMAAESFASRHSQAFSTMGFPYSERNGRARISNTRYRSFVAESSVPDRVMPEDIMAMNYSTYYGSRTLLDQHREMRLDIDDMSYEELLALGDRIGSVNTGLSDGLISKCLTPSIYCSSDQLQDDGTCVICLEEYKEMDDVGTLKCDHDFHVGCIRKWLSVKSLCPICKASAIDDDSIKEELST